MTDNSVRTGEASSRSGPKNKVDPEWDELKSWIMSEEQREWGPFLEWVQTEFGLLARQTLSEQLRRSYATHDVLASTSKDLWKSRETFVKRVRDGKIANKDELKSYIAAAIRNKGRKEGKKKKNKASERPDDVTGSVEDTQFLSLWSKERPQVIKNVVNEGVKKVLTKKKWSSSRRGEIAVYLDWARNGAASGTEKPSVLKSDQARKTISVFRTLLREEIEQANGHDVRIDLGN